MGINLQLYDLKVRKDGDESISVYDRLRKKYVSLTPEENIRQRFVEYLINEECYPAGLMNNEISIIQNGISRRCDTVVFDKKGNPVMIIEYKAPHIKITQEVFDQIYRYNLVLKVKYLVVTNGKEVFCCMNDYDNMKCSFIRQIPAYSTLLE